MKNLKNIFFAIIAVALLQACSPADGEFGGSEYMPDMGHSIAYEANVYNYYYYNTWDSASTFKLKELSAPGLPVKGTVPRGYAGVYLAGNSASGNGADVLAHLQGEEGVNEIAVPINGSSPYYYEDTEDERTRAMAEIIDNPYPITAAGLAKGKELYDIFCGICHGENADGAGYLVREADPAAGDAGGVYPAAPANFLLEEHLNASNGRYYHAIMYGKNVMGGYADKLSFEERWQVIHYIRSLQAKSLKATYSADANTFNAVFGTPASQMNLIVEDLSATPGAADQDQGVDHGTGTDHNTGETHDGGTDQDTGHEGDHDSDSH